MWTTFEQRWFSAYELLRGAGARLIDKQSSRGENWTRGQRLFCLLFPLLSILLVAVVLGGLWLYTYVQFLAHIEPQTYYWAAPLWHIGLQLLAVALLLFAAPSYFDIQRALRLLNESSQQPPEQTDEQRYEGERP